MSRGAVAVQAQAAAQVRHRLGHHHRDVTGENKEGENLKWESRGGRHHLRAVSTDQRGNSASKWESQRGRNHETKTCQWQVVIERNPLIEEIITEEETQVQEHIRRRNRGIHQVLRLLCLLRNLLHAKPKKRTKTHCLTPMLKKLIWITTNLISFQIRKTLSFAAQMQNELDINQKLALPNLIQKLNPVVSQMMTYQIQTGCLIQTHFLILMMPCQTLTLYLTLT